MGSSDAYGLTVRLDHVSYAVSHAELSDTVQRLGAELGAAFIDGGRHPSFGTCNFILPLQGGIYLEVVSPLDHPASDRAPFGQAVKARAEAGGGWLGWVVSVQDMSAVESRLGRTAVSGHRLRPDGYDLKWQQIGVMDLIADPQLPFFIQWSSPTEEHPSRGGAGVTLSALEICGDGDVISEYLGEPRLHPLENIDVDFVKGDYLGIQKVTFQTGHGPVVID